MKVVVRADASARIGSGHVTRCLSLADELAAAGASVTFICRERPGHLCDLIETRGHSVARLPVSSSIPDDDALGATIEEDAAATCAAVGQQVDWLIVDHYRLDASWERSVRSVAQRIMVIDDLADREHDCDLLLDQNLVAGMTSRYEGKAPRNATLLLGPRYALIDPLYAERHPMARVRRGTVKRVLAFFGGGDNTHVTLHAVDAFCALNEAVVFDVVAAVGADRIRRRVANHPNINVHDRVSTLVPMIERADLFLGAGGSTNWERLCLGVPTVIITIAENQRPPAAELHRLGLVRWLGDAADVSVADIQAALGAILESGLDPDWSRRCLEVVDGNGVERVRDSLLAPSGSSLRVRPVTADDASRLLEWANDSTTRTNAFNGASISPEAHHRWFNARLANPGVARIYMVETSTGIPVAQVRFDKQAHGWLIDYSVAPHVRGRGFGRRALDLALDELFRVEPAAAVVGEVKLTNVASCRVFESLGFARTVDGERAVYRRPAPTR